MHTLNRNFLSIVGNRILNGVDANKVGVINYNGEVSYLLTASGRFTL